MATQSASSASNNTFGRDQFKQQPWIRGVNLGGWLMMERWIVPYQFALTDCHLRGDFCWYPGQINAPPKSDPNYRLCDLYQCHPMEPDYPQDEYTMGQVFRDYATAQNSKNPDASTHLNGTKIAEDWLNYHFEHFLTKDDIRTLALAGVTHFRVPIPHWILGSIDDDGAVRAPWIVGKRWEYFLRLVEWCREYKLEVWPDIHSAPGSQNGFDNSGRTLPDTTCKNWSDNPYHVAKSLQILKDVAHAIVREGIQDVVTGLGLLNEPFVDCDMSVYFQFVEEGRKSVREILGNDVTIYVSDLFRPYRFNDGSWWLNRIDETVAPQNKVYPYEKTFLDSHFYQVFGADERELSPRQHIAYVCQDFFRETTDCCFYDAPLNSQPVDNHSVKRMVGEWSAAYDILPSSMLEEIMAGIRKTGIAPYLNRELSVAQRKFLLSFVQAQMVTFESYSVGVTGAWFFWSFKLEGGAYAEWDFMRGLAEGWMPKIPAPNVNSEDLYGSCYDIIFRTSDDYSIVQELPPRNHLPDGAWMGPPLDDDVVLSHGNILQRDKQGQFYNPEVHERRNMTLFYMGTIVCMALMLFASRSYLRTRKRREYKELSKEDEKVIAMT